MDFIDPHTLWFGLAKPLIRLIFFVCVGLLVGNLIESLNWTRAMGRLAEPLIRFARLKDISGASFSLAFFSGVAANSMLAESLDKGKLTEKELVLSNLFNSLPTYFLHLPTIFFIAAPFIGDAAFVYVGLTLLAAFGRTLFIICWGRFTLPPLDESCVVCVLEDVKDTTFRQALHKAWKRFKKRLPKILYFTVPIYTLFFIFKQTGVFDYLQNSLSGLTDYLTFLTPEALSIIVFQLAAEFTAGLAAAGSLLHAGEMQTREVVLALIVGNVLSSPMRAVRHQFPYYAGIFKPRLAVKLITYSQTLRGLSIVIVGVMYAIFSA